MNWLAAKMRIRREIAPARANGQAVPTSPQMVFSSTDLGNWYRPVMLGPDTLGNLATSPACLRQVIQIVERLEPDDYVRYLLAYYHTGLGRFGDAWRYADIATVLMAAAEMVQPQSYLEIGVRRGRSLAIVAASCPECEIVGFDLWTPNYAGMPNPGPEFVRTELEKLRYRGRLDLIAGNSHETLPRFLADNPNAFFDIVTVDGDHSERGAAQDLHDVLPRVKVGGVVVMDDICHPSHPYLADVWQRLVTDDARFLPWQFTELGYGVALAVRREA